MVTRVIADVDTGVDDALALLFLARHPAIDLLAVTCVAGNCGVDTVVRNTLDVLGVAGASTVPVARGADRPLLGTARPASAFHGVDGLGGIKLTTSRARARDIHAVELLRETVLASDEAVTLLALGPLTNVALLIRMWPDVVARLERIVFMGGSAGTGNASPVAEFNAWHDPEAVAIVLGAPVPVTMYGLDVFYDMAVDRADYLPLIDSADPVRALAGKLLRHSDALGSDARFATGGLLGDAGAACMIADPEVVSIGRFPTTIELSGTIARGQTVVDRRTVHGEQEEHGARMDHPLIDVALMADSERMAALFLQTLDPREGAPL